MYSSFLYNYTQQMFLKLHFFFTEVFRNRFKVPQQILLPTLIPICFGSVQCVLIPFSSIRCLLIVNIYLSYILPFTIHLFLRQSLCKNTYNFQMYYSCCSNCQQMALFGCLHVSQVKPYQFVLTNVQITSEFSSKIQRFTVKSLVIPYT